MPLLPGKSEKSFKHNVSVERHHGKPLKQSLAIAYAMKKKSKGSGCDCGDSSCPGCYAEGGKVKGVHRGRDTGTSKAGQFVRQAKTDKSFGDYFKNRGEDYEAAESYADSGDAMRKAKRMHLSKLGELAALRGLNRQNLAHGGEVDDDLVGRCMAKKYSKGGRVANDTDFSADEENNDFDYLAHNDDLEFSYDGENSGDYEDNERENDDEEDIVRRIMKSLRKKDRLPRPA